MNLGRLLFRSTNYNARTGGWILLAIILCGCEEKQRVDMKFVAGIAMMVHSMQLQRDVCSALFPDDSQIYIRQYEQSHVAKYGQVFDYERRFEFGDGQVSQDSLGRSNGESRQSCNEDFPKNLKMFDSEYAEYIDDVAALLPRLEKEAESVAARRAQERANPSGEQDDLLFGNIVESLNRSFSSGDWSILASLYGNGAFDCWNVDGRETNYAFLARPQITLDARHAIRPLERGYHPGRGAKLPSPPPTHLLEIRFDVTYSSKCSDRKTHRWPRYHFLLRKDDQEYKLVHGCPTDIYIDRFAGEHLPLSQARVDSKLSSLPEEERILIPEEIRRFANTLETVTRLVNKYKLSYNEAYLVIDDVCRVVQ